MSLAAGRRRRKPGTGKGWALWWQIQFTTDGDGAAIVSVMRWTFSNEFLYVLPPYAPGIRRNPRKSRR